MKYRFKKENSDTLVFASFGTLEQKPEGLNHLSEIDLETLSESTKYYDKDGTEIYGSPCIEIGRRSTGGDLIVVEDELGKVVWNEGLMQWTVDFVPYDSDVVPLWETI